jgi:alkyl hydroperoxide reductase subunit AhpF
MTSNPSNSGCLSVRGLRSPACLLAARNCPDLVQALKSTCVARVVCDELRHVALAFQAAQQVKGDETIDLAAPLCPA